MKTIEKCPCEQCLTKPICRNRKYHYLVNLCEPLADFLHLKKGESYKHTGKSKREIKIHKRRVLRFQTVIKPTGWKIGPEHLTGFHIVLPHSVTLGDGTERNRQEK